jgi:mono/diheme cytochrome c family protein
MTMRSPSAPGLILLAALAFSPEAALAQMSPSAQRGLTFVQANCSQCHAVEQVGESRLPIAPPLRTFPRKFPAENLEVALVRAARAGHPNMPAFLLDRAQLIDVIAYLKTFER